MLTQGQGEGEPTHRPSLGIRGGAAVSVLCLLPGLGHLQVTLALSQDKLCYRLPHSPPKAKVTHHYLMGTTLLPLRWNPWEGEALCEVPIPDSFWVRLSPLSAAFL